MRTKVDQIKCKTFGICVELCPEVFRFQAGSKKAVAIEGEIPAYLLDKCLEAECKCPEEAITVFEHKEVTNDQ